jgi:hypothetical protein
MDAPDYAIGLALLEMRRPSVVATPAITVPPLALGDSDREGAVGLGVGVAPRW